MTIRNSHVLLAATLFAMTGGLLSAQGGDAKPPTVSELIERLGDDSYQVRRDAEQALRAQGAAAVEELRKAAESHGDAEVKWRAKRLLRQGDGADPRGLSPRLPGAPDGGAPRTGRFRAEPDFEIGTRFDRLFEQIERELGTELPRAKFFGGDFFQDLEARMEEMRRGMPPLGQPGHQFQAGQGFSLRVDGEGVRVQISEEGEGGKSETKTYEAPDLETFRAKYPAIAERYLSGDPQGRVFSFGPGGWSPLPAVPPVGLGAPPLDPGDDGRDRLGVFVDEVPPALREFLDLPTDVGLRVRSVVGESIAARAGVEAGDILLEVAGRKVASPEDVRGALRALDGGAGFDVKVNRRGEARTLRGQAPALQPKDSEAKDSEARHEDSSGLRKRQIR